VSPLPCTRASEAERVRGEEKEECESVCVRERGEGGGEGAEASDNACHASENGVIPGYVRVRMSRP
jgi:hypothetical protein